MKVIIVEDEPLAAERLEGLIKEFDPAIEILTRCDSVVKTVKWFQTNNLPDLIFMDIQLGDGLSFEIFDQVRISCPVIFTTAYNEYAIEAFKVNSLAYLLKPIKFNDLSNAIQKFKSSPWFTGNVENTQQQFTYEKVLKMLSNQFKKRFLIKTGVHIKSISVEDIMYFYSLNKGTFLTTVAGKNHLADYSLEQLEELLDPVRFFRINRKYIISVSSIEDIITFSNYRLKLVLKHCEDEDILVSREKMQEFKEWLDK